MISIIAALSRNHVIGNKGKLPWHLPNDLKFFKEKTIGHTVIMGRKTFNSIGNRPLPNRHNIIITNQKSFSAHGCSVAHSLEEALKLAPPDREIFITGGQSIYKAAMPIADQMYLTLIDAKIEGDTHFPEFSETDWKLCSELAAEPDQKNAFAHKFLTYVRRR